MQMKEITYKEALREAMVEEMRRDEDIIFLGEDIGVYGGGFGVSYGMIEEFGEESKRYPNFRSGNSRMCGRSSCNWFKNNNGNYVQ